MNARRSRWPIDKACQVSGPMFIAQKTTSKGAKLHTKPVLFRNLFQYAWNLHSQEVSKRFIESLVLLIQSDHPTFRLQTVANHPNWWKFLHYLSEFSFVNIAIDTLSPNPNDLNYYCWRRFKAICPRLQHCNDIWINYTRAIPIILVSPFLNSCSIMYNLQVWTLMAKFITRSGTE